MITEKEKKYREELFKLMKENPELPVIPFVDGEIVTGDDFGMWMGSWGSAYIDEYLIPPNSWEPIIFKSDNDVFDTLEKYLSDEEFDALPKNEVECQKIYDELSWIKAIIVNICLPD